jgi:Na+-transporting NADH:ubiquinone oxidoreductase subunit C
MAINKDSNVFTFGFAIAMVVVVGTILAVAAMGLKDRQKANVQQEKMKNILSTIGAMDADGDRSKAKTLFDKHVVDQKVFNANGEILEDAPAAFKIDVRKEYKSLPESKRHYPLYVCEKDGETYYVIPMVGTGLWGPIWGYVALEGDMETIYGTSFDHKGETPGLGAEISQSAFQEQFEGKTIFNQEGKFVSVGVLKTGAEGNKHAVDGITGGTITSKGVDEMIERTIGTYVPYFKTKKA